MPLSRARPSRSQSYSARARFQAHSSVWTSRAGRMALSASSRWAMDRFPIWWDGPSSDSSTSGGIRTSCVLLEIFIVCDRSDEAATKMLIDSFIQNPDAIETHKIEIAASRETVYQALWTTDLGGSPIIKCLMALRSLPGIVSHP